MNDRLKRYYEEWQQAYRESGCGTWKGFWGQRGHGPYPYDHLDLSGAFMFGLEDALRDDILTLLGHSTEPDGPLYDEVDNLVVTHLNREPHLATVEGRQAK